MKALITGSQGFVGYYLRQELEEHGYEVIGLDLTAGPNTIQGSLLDESCLASAIQAVKPNAVFHLAGQANVGASWKIPKKTFELNVIAAVNLLEAVRVNAPDSRIVMVGSSDQYGNLGGAGKLVNETMELRPETPYAVSKKAQEEISAVYACAYGLNVCMTRSFNHYGPGQKEGFLLSDFASGIVRVEKGLASCLKVGNLDAKRDFTYVGDVVRAYRLIAEKGRSGEVYNVGSGMAYSAREILDKLLAMANSPIPVEQDPAKMRPSDTPVICCNHGKLTADTGWTPEIEMEPALAGLLTDWRKRLL